jgi:hypothetical protein
VFDIVFLGDFEYFLPDFIEGAVVYFLPFSVDCEHDFVLEVRLQVYYIQCLQSVQNDAQAVVIDLFGLVGRMFFIFPQIITDFGQAFIITSFAIHVLNAIYSAVVFIVVVILEFDGSGEGADNVPAEAFDVKDVAGPDVSMVYFFLV